MAKRIKTGGRTKGTPNKMTAAVKEMVLEALDRAGGVDYLVLQSRDNPTAFMTLVGKVLPLQLTGADGGAIQTESKSTLNVEGMTGEQLRALASITLQPR